MHLTSNRDRNGSRNRSGKRSVAVRAKRLDSRERYALHECSDEEMLDLVRPEPRIPSRRYSHPLLSERGCRENAGGSARDANHQCEPQKPSAQPEARFTLFTNVEISSINRGTTGNAGSL